MLTIKIISNEVHLNQSEKLNLFNFNGIKFIRYYG